MILMKLRFPNGRGILAAAIYSGTLFLWAGRAVGDHRSVSFILNDNSPSHTGAGRWSW